MPTRYFRRRAQPGFRKVFRRRATPVIAGGQVRRVTGGVARNAPVYTYQSARVSHRKLIHMVPLVTAITPLSIHSVFSIVPTGSAPYSSGVLLNGVAQGDGLDARHANKIWMTELIVTWSLSTTLKTSDDLAFNVVVVYDRESRGLPPALTDVFDQADPLTMQRVSTRERFDVLYRSDPTVAPQRQWNGTAVGAYPSTESVRHRSFKVPIFRSTVYSNPTGTYADILKGSLYLFVFNSVAPSAGSQTIYVNYRIMFSDIE